MYVYTSRYIVICIYRRSKKGKERVSQLLISVWRFLVLAGWYVSVFSYVYVMGIQTGKYSDVYVQVKIRYIVDIYM